MQHTPVMPNPEDFPEIFRPFLSTPVYDSSCSPDARVWFLDREDGFYLKSAPKGSLKAEADMTRYFHGKGLGAEVLHYLSADRDWLLTRKLPGQDCTHGQYLENPKRLCDTIAAKLRQLHETDFTGCPVSDRMDSYFTSAQRNFRAGAFDPSFLPQSLRCGSAREAWQLVCENQHALTDKVLLHGDYCLPNILLDDWKFSGFIDVGNGGVGDRHIDIFWGIWSLYFNLKSEAYSDRFLDAYGRDAVQPELLRLIAAVESCG